MKFFRAFRQRLLRENTPGNYLLYAIGEILLLVFGILIALQVDNWNESRQKQEQGEEFRAQIREAVYTDMENIRTRMEFFTQALEFGYSAQQEMGEPRAQDLEAQWQFIVQTFHVSQLWNFNQATAVYNEAQKPEMLGFLGSPELLNALQRYYTEWPLQLAVLTGGTQAYRDFVRSVIPIEMQQYMWDACYTISVLDVQSFVPCSAPRLAPEKISEVYQAIVEDPEYKRILTLRLSTLYTRNIVYENMLQEAEALVELLSEH